MKVYPGKKNPFATKPNKFALRLNYPLPFEFAGRQTIFVLEYADKMRYVFKSAGNANSIYIFIGIAK